jgi:hypothetical protein
MHLAQRGLLLGSVQVVKHERREHSIEGVFRVRQLVRKLLIELDRERSAPSLAARAGGAFTPNSLTQPVP